MSLKVTEEHVVKACDIVHLLTASEYVKEDTIKRYSGDPITQQYYEYMKNAYEPEKRDYQALRRLLTLIQIVYRQTLQDSIESVVINQEIDTGAVRFVYDLGAGTSKWWDILLKTFPCIEGLTRVDKDAQALKNPLYTMHVTDVNMDINEFLNSNKCGSGREHLYFMSELLHCKQFNRQFLTHDKICRSNIIVNELWDNPFINYRLALTGGGLLSPDNVKEASGFNFWSVARYSAYFDYYVMAKAI